MSLARGLPVTAGPVCVGGGDASFRQQRGGGSGAWLFTQRRRRGLRGLDERFSPPLRVSRIQADYRGGWPASGRGSRPPCGVCLRGLRQGSEAGGVPRRMGGRVQGGYKGAADGCRAWTGSPKVPRPRAVRAWGGGGMRELGGLFGEAVFRCGSRRRNRRRRAGRLRWRARCRRLPEASARAGEAGRRRLPHPAGRRERARAAAGCRRP